MVPETTIIMKTAVKYGFLAGLQTLLFFTAIYFIHKEWLFHPAIFWISLFFYIWWMVVRGKKLVDLSTPPLHNRVIIRELFLVFLFANLLYWAIYFLLMQSIPELLQLKTEADIAFLKKSAHWINPDLSDIDLQEAIREITVEKNRVKGKDVVLSYAWGSLGGFLLSVALTFLIKRK